MQDIVAQYLYIKNFSDNKKVLVESSEYGNLTAKDIKKLYKNEDKKNEFFNKLYDLESTKNDDEIFKIAEKLLNEEFGFVLNINPDDVPTYIGECII